MAAPETGPRPAPAPDPGGEVERLRAWVARLEARLFGVLDIEAALEAARNEERRLCRERDALDTRLQYYRELFDFAPIPCLTLSSAGIIGLTNLSAAALLGRPRASLEGLPLLNFVARDCRPSLLDLLRIGRESVTPMRQEIMLAADGRDLPVEIHCHHRPMQPELLLATLTDLSDRRWAEEERRRAAEAEAVSQAKDRFLAALSHELRTPLAPIANVLAVMRGRTDLPADLLPLIDMIERNLWREVRLVEDLLDVTRLVSRKVQLRLQDVDLHEVLREVGQEREGGFRGAGIALGLQLDAAAWHIEADPQRIQQVFCNLLDNACKFTPAGGAVRVTTRNPGPDQIQVTVEDTGVGLTPGATGRLFEPFEQAESASHGGLGLGLAIVKGLVDAHRGSIAAHSEGLNRGATFVVNLPVLQQA